MATDRRYYDNKIKVAINPFMNSIQVNDKNCRNEL